VPIYEYVCKACGGLNEVWQKIDAPAPEECELCHKGPLAKKISATGFVLKGGGWYVTDFRGGSTGGKAAPEASGDANAKGEAKSDGAKTEGTKTEGGSSSTDKSGSSGSSGSSGGSGTGGHSCGSGCAH
jgi:putative FmdB family regulatory protein